MILVATWPWVGIIIVSIVGVHMTIQKIKACAVFEKNQYWAQAFIFADLKPLLSRGFR